MRGRGQEAGGRGGLGRLAAGSGGWVLGERPGGASLAAQVTEDGGDDVGVEKERQAEIAPPLAVLVPLNEQIGILHDEFASVAHADEVARILVAAPGVGPIAAVSYVATLDRVERFANAHRVEGSLGLVPVEWSSSELQRRERSRADSLNVVDRHREARLSWIQRPSVDGVAFSDPSASRGRR